MPFLKTLQPKKEKGEMDKRNELTMAILYMAPPLRNREIRDRTNPGYPSAAMRPKRQLPRRLKRLEKFIWLEECPQTECVCETKSKEEA